MALTEPSSRTTTENAGHLYCTGVRTINPPALTYPVRAKLARRTSSNESNYTECGGSKINLTVPLFPVPEGTAARLVIWPGMVYRSVGRISDCYASRANLLRTCRGNSVVQAIDMTEQDLEQPCPPRVKRSEVMTFYSNVADELDSHFSRALSATTCISRPLDSLPSPLDNPPSSREAAEHSGKPGPTCMRFGHACFETIVHVEIFYAAITKKSEIIHVLKLKIMPYDNLNNSAQQMIPLCTTATVQVAI